MATSSWKDIRPELVERLGGEAVVAQAHQRNQAVIDAIGGPRGVVESMLPGVVFVPLRSRHLQDLELSCLYRREDPSPVLAMFLEVVRAHGKSEKKGGRGRFRPA